MAKVQPFTNLQLSALVILRFLAGWHLLYEGVSKLLNPGWSAAGFLGESQWIMSGISNWIVSNNNVLNAVDFLNTWGLIAIGLGLILGLFTSFAAFSGAILLFIYYFNNAPIVGIEYTIPSEGNNLLVNKTLIEAMSLFVLAVFPTGSIIGLDVFINRLKIRK
ncbi:putative membrane protein [Proteiniphilum saccharofermentans]|jgi:thiosulfate dehydrogenase [quinone] large subunit|uniref:Putative membrane protein n=1 Tax=Proteiniphilum saccharofermentans TaxID=1642647 RepID=A0A1R3TDD1_9BACT|nr:DoxX family membrane protein [Proteiniphilum saccharofermentans]NLU28399.1 DoxX family membrane protein [Bacteroidales bacterium]SCD22005.1 putative membrane protein [Proteiniphilum saccharofermentans]